MLLLHYGTDPNNLHQIYNGCQEKFSFTNVLDLKKDGLNMTWNNELHDGLSDLSLISFAPLYLCNNCLIHTDNFIQDLSTQSSGQIQRRNHMLNNTLLVLEDLKNKGELLIWDICKKGTKNIHDMHIVNTDASYYPERYLKKCLQMSDNEKKYVPGCVTP